jgi:hypothetical protein
MRTKLTLEDLLQVSNSWAITRDRQIGVWCGRDCDENELPARKEGVSPIWLTRMQEAGDAVEDSQGMFSSRPNDCDLTSLAPVHIKRLRTAQRRTADRK